MHQGIFLEPMDTTDISKEICDAITTDFLHTTANPFYGIRWVFPSAFPQSPEKRLASFAGMISDEEAEELRRIIRDGCEGAEEGGW